MRLWVLIWKMPGSGAAGDACGTCMKAAYGQEVKVTKTIMTVDDSASVRLMVNFTLKQLGYEILEAANGKEALKKLAGRKIHMLITDVNMPELDGLSLVRKVRED